MGWGLLAVGVLALAAFVGVVLYADRAEDGWREDRVAVRKENVERVGSGQPLDDPPAAPFVVRQTVPVAIGAALVVAVVGSILVLLFVIASGRRRE